MALVRTSLRWILLASSFASAACVSTPDRGTTPPSKEPTLEAPPDSFPTMKQTVGAQGGTIDGASGTVFEGLRLVIPAGALSADTEITISQSEDGTPLPIGARRIGPQFAFGPAGTTLAAPASLTLPAVPDEVESYGSTTSDMKAWRLEGGAWTRSEPTATADGLVTVDLPDLTTIAAGVKFVPAPVSCIGNVACYAAAACKQGIGFCVKSYGTLDPMPEDSKRSFVSQNDYVFYMTATPSGMQVVEKVFNTSTGGLYNSLQSASMPGLSSVRANPAVEMTPAGFRYWVGTGPTGQAAFVPLAQSSSLTRNFFGQPLYGLGAIRTQNVTQWVLGPTSTYGDTFYRIAGPGSPNYAENGVIISSLAWGQDMKFVPTSNTDEGGDLITVYGNWYDGTGFGGSYVAFLDATANPTPWGTESISGHPMTLPGALVFSVAVGNTGEMAIVQRDSGEAGAHVMLYKNGGVIRLDMPTGAANIPGEVVFDQSDGLWIRPINSAQLFYFPRTGSSQADLATTALSNAAVTDPAYTNAIPHRILRLDGNGGIISINLGGEAVGVSFGVPL